VGRDRQPSHHQTSYSPSNSSLHQLLGSGRAVAHNTITPRGNRLSPDAVSVPGLMIRWCHGVGRQQLRQPLILKWQREAYLSQADLPFLLVRESIRFEITRDKYPTGGVSAVSFIEIFHKARAEAGREGHSPIPTAERPMPWIEQLKRAKSEALARSADPWRFRLERARGKVGYDGVERVSTQDLFDFLEVPQRGRTAGACRRLAALMRELGWTPMKARGLGPSGFRDQVRGYARDKKN
jgi:hypothetical protein